MEYGYRKRASKCEGFPEITDEIIPGDERVGSIRPYYSSGKLFRLIQSNFLQVRSYFFRGLFFISPVSASRFSHFWIAPIGTWNISCVSFSVSDYATRPHRK